MGRPKCKLRSTAKTVSRVKILTACFPPRKTGFECCVRFKQKGVRTRQILLRINLVFCLFIFQQYSTQHFILIQHSIGRTSGRSVGTLKECSFGNHEKKEQKITCNFSLGAMRTLTGTRPVSVLKKTSKQYLCNLMQVTIN